MRLISILFMAVLVFAGELKISSQKFFYDSKKLVSVFEGDVNAKKDKDTIIADVLKVYFNKQRKPLKIEAIGNVKFTIAMDKNSTYKGRCQHLFYNIKTGDVLLIGNAFIKKIETNESISGEKIKINRLTKDVEVIGNSKKPVNIIIKVD